MNRQTRRERTRDLILLVEDSATQAFRTRIALEEAGFEVKICANGTMALAMAAEHEPDLILLDIHLPDLNGREVAQRLKADPILSGIPIVFMTGVFREIEDIISGLNEGADDYLCKPVTDRELIARVRATLRAHQTLREVGRLARLLFTVNQIGSQLAGILDLGSLLTSVVQLIHETFGYPQVHVFLREGDELVLAAAAGPSSDRLLANAPRLPLCGSSLAAVSARGGSLQLLGETDAETISHPFVSGARSGVAAPLHSGGEVSGALEIISPDAMAFSGNDRLVLQTLADLVGVAVHNSRTYLAMEEMAMVDELTGLLNRRKTLARLNDEWERCQRYDNHLALIGLDLDTFKKVNDRFGHPTGDRAMQAIATLVRQAIRQIDAAGRVGGDEFLLILPETNLSGAFDVAERLRKACEALALSSESGERIPVTLSLGVASWPETKAAEPAELIRATDQALYRAKQAGRNRTSL